MTTVPVSQSFLGFTGGVLSSMTAYSFAADQIRQDARAIDRSLQAFRRTVEYGLPLFIRDEVTNRKERKRGRVAKLMDQDSFILSVFFDSRFADQKVPSKKKN